MNILLKIITLLLIVPTTVWAEPNGIDQALNAAQQRLATAHSAQADNVRITVKRPDSRLTLKTCSHPPEAQPTNSLPKSGKVTVKVHCTAPSEWSIYLPAEVLYRVELWTSRNNIDRGAIVAATDIEKNLRWLTHPPAGAMQNPEKIIGMEARHSIRAGSVIKQRLLQRPLIIRKGHRLSVAVQQRGFRLSTEVIALEDGADGDTIKVRNAKTEKLLWAKIGREGNLIIN